MTSKRFEHENLKIFITDEHIHYKGTFIMDCFILGIKEKTLEAKCYKDAQIEAFGIVLGKIRELERNYQSIAYHNPV